MKKNIDIQAVQQRIAENAVSIHEQATVLQNNILKFEEYLTVLPGKVPVVLELKGMILHFSRESGPWGLWVEKPNQELRRLREAPLRDKIQVMGVLPDILWLLQSSQEKVIEEIQQTCKEFDLWFSTLPPHPEKVKKKHYTHQDVNAVLPVEAFLPKDRYGNK